MEDNGVMNANLAVCVAPDDDVVPRLRSPSGPLLHRARLAIGYHMFWIPTSASGSNSICFDRSLVSEKNGVVTTNHKGTRQAATTLAKIHNCERCLCALCAFVVTTPFFLNETLTPSATINWP